LSSEQQFLYLTTTGWKSRKQHKIEIWFICYNKRYYIISERLDLAHWVQNILHEPKVLFAIGIDKFEGLARIVNSEESALVNTVSNMMNSKYSWSDGLIVELIPNDI
jgi:F420H(2)-dependent quinone reductase